MRCLVTPTVMSTPARSPPRLGHSATIAAGSVAVVSRLELWGVEGIGEIRPGDVLADLIADACRRRPTARCSTATCSWSPRRSCPRPRAASSPVDPDDPLSHKAVVEQEAVRILRRRGDLVITETRHGFVCANSGVDLSNVERGQAALLPLDSDRSARRIRDGLRARLGVERRRHRQRHLRPAVAQGPHRRRHRRAPASPPSSTSGAPRTPSAGTMQVTEVAVADELAAAAELVMGKSSGIPVAVVRGVDPAGSARRAWRPRSSGRPRRTCSAERPGSA